MDINLIVLSVKDFASQNPMALVLMGFMFSFVFMWCVTIWAIARGILKRFGTPETAQEKHLRQMKRGARSPIYSYTKKN